MSDYKELLGLDIEAKSADPTDVITGEVWFNTSTNQFKYKKPDGANTWTTSGNLIVGRRLAGQGTIGIQTSALCISGLDGYASKTENESYNGSSWTELGDVNASRYLASAFGADATAAIFCGGFGPPTGSAANESWNGSSWTEVNDLNTGRNYSVGAGVQTAGLVFGDSSSNEVESWDGTNWTEVGDTNAARYSSAAAGVQTSALHFGGANPPTGSALCESWNGSSWTEVGDLNTARKELAGAGASNTSALAFSGGPNGPTQTESWNGSSWTEVNDMNTGQTMAAGAGTQTLALVFGGGFGSAHNTEEFSPVDGTQVVDDA